MSSRRGFLRGALGAGAAGAGLAAAGGIPALLKLGDVIGSPETKGIDLQASGSVRRSRPFDRLAGDMEAPRLKIYLGIARAIVRGGRKYTGLHGGDASDDIVETGSTKGVADLGLE